MNASAGDIPGVAVRPPRLYVGALAGAALLNWGWPAHLFAGPVDGAARLAGTGIGVSLMLLGALLMAAAMGRFRHRATPIETWKPSTALVTGGLYRYSRNPIYVALTVMYTGAALALDNLWAVLLLVPVIFIMRFGVISREERYLEARFGDAYRVYRAGVRRWL